MKCLIKDTNEASKKEFKVKRMNYDQVLININNAINIYKIDEVELIPEGEIDELLIDKKDLLKIKLKRGMSVFVYKYLYNSLKDKFDEEIDDINLLKDKYEVLNKRGYWQKTLYMMLNSKYPCKVKITGKNFSKEGYEIEIYEFEKKEFLSLCVEEIRKIEIEIEDKNKILGRFGKAMLEVKEKSIINDKNLIGN